MSEITRAERVRQELQCEQNQLSATDSEQNGWIGQIYYLSHCSKSIITLTIIHKNGEFGGGKFTHTERHESLLVSK